MGKDTTRQKKNHAKNAKKYGIKQKLFSFNTPPPPKKKILTSNRFRERQQLPLIRGPQEEQQLLLPLHPSLPSLSLSLPGVHSRVISADR